jgi:hypothetical protein
MNEQTRAYIYRIFVALLPVLILYGVLSDAEAAVWLGVGAAVLSAGESALAARHTSTKSDDHTWRYPG